MSFADQMLARMQSGVKPQSVTTSHTDIRDEPDLSLKWFDHVMTDNLIAWCYRHVKKRFDDLESVAVVEFRLSVSEYNEMKSTKHRAQEFFPFLIPAGLSDGLIDSPAFVRSYMKTLDSKTRKGVSADKLALIYGTVVYYCSLGDSAVCNASQKTLAEKAEITDRTLRNGLQVLRSLEPAFIIQTHVGGSATGDTDFYELDLSTFNPYNDTSNRITKVGKLFLIG